MPTALDLDEGLILLADQGRGRGTSSPSVLRGIHPVNAAEARSVVGDLTADYRTTLLRFLPRRDEAARAAAYDVGRRAFSQGVSLLDLCRVHHEVALDVLRETQPG